MIRLILALIFAAGAAQAQVARITTGDHEGFTRVVIVSSGLGTWGLGRTPEGYQFDPGTQSQRYDLSDAFRRITKDRISTVWADPETGRLSLGISCDCHAIAFEYRDDTVVIDIRNGPPPQDSPFELSLDGKSLPSLSAEPALRARPRPAKTAQTYNWLSAQADQPEETAEVAFQLPVSASSLDPLRQELVREIGAGLSEGVLQRADRLPRPSGNATEGSPWAQIAIGDVPGFQGRSVMDEPEETTTATCPDPDLVSVQDWLPDEDPVVAISQSRQALVEEFDRPNPENIRAAARTLIAFGFGAEAGQLLDQLQPDAASAKENELLHSLSRLVDGKVHPDGPFASLADCPSPAALWAFLTVEANPPRPSRRGEVLSAFSALPVHLREALASALVDRFLAVDDASAAASVRQSLVRGSTEASPPSRLIEAEIELESGSPERAELAADEIVAEDSQTADERLILLIRAKLAQKKSVDPAEATALASLLPQYEGSIRHAEIANLLTLATLASGAAKEARALLENTPSVEPEFWALLAETSTDDALLEQAVRAKDAPSPTTQPETALLISERLFRAGFTEVAIDWASEVTGPLAERARILLAQAELKRNDPAAAIAILNGVQTRESQVLLAQAHEMAGNWPSAETYWSSLGDKAAVNRVDFLAKNWSDISQSPSSDWKATASRLSRQPVAGQEQGPLAQSQTLLAESEADRALLNDLISKASSSAP